MFNKICFTISLLFSSLEKKSGILKKAIFLLFIASILLSSFTYYKMSNENVMQLTSSSNMDITAIISINIALLIILSTAVLYKVIMIFVHNRKQMIGSRLQSRILITFAMISIIPTFIISILSTIFFNYGIQSWFNDKIRGALDASVGVAKAYLNEHNNNISADIIAIAHDINSKSLLFRYNNIDLNNTIQAQTILRNLTEVVVFQPNKILARNNLSILLDFETLPRNAIEQADDGNVVILASDSYDKVRALIKLTGTNNTYLVIGRLVDSQVLNHIGITRGAVDSYKELERNISELQLQFSTMFFIVSVILLLLSIWIGILFAGKFTEPIVELITATKKIGEGNFSIRIAEKNPKEEITSLAIALNQMTQRIQNQHSQLIQANQQINERKIFIETILRDISSGIIVFDKNMTISLANGKTKSLLSISDKIVGKYILSVFPEAEKVTNKILTNNMLNIEEQVYISRAKKSITALVKIVPTIYNTDKFIMTINDISEIVEAQKLMVWADIARKMAHEIKNPITPINLSAERIYKKFSKYIPTDQAHDFSKYLETIMKNVSNISYITDEFTNFARMPSPILQKIDICKYIKNAAQEAVFNVKIKHEINIPKNNIFVKADKILLHQVIINIIKNSSEAIQNVLTPIVKVSIKEQKNNVSITVEDNGSGFSQEIINKATEPYITTKEKGTGLGLAIAKKIILDHNGKLFLYNSNYGGAVVKITLPKIKNEQNSK